MTLAIHSLHQQVTRLVEQQHGEVTGKLRGGVAANTEGRFQGLTVTNGARDTEKAFAREVLHHVQEIALNQNDVSELHKSTVRFNQNNFELRSLGNGQSQLVGLRSDQLTLRDAKTLLDAAMRQQGAQRHGPSAPAGQDAPPLPPRQAPALPPRNAGPALAQQHERLMSAAPRMVTPAAVDPYGAQTKRELSSRLAGLQQQLQPSVQPDRYLQSRDGSQLNRFNDIRANKMTAVRPDLNANYVQVGTHRSIACQYPLDSQLESHLQMLFDNRTPVLAVLASANEIANPQFKMPDYFRQNGQYGAMSVTSTHKESIDLGDGIQADVYQMALTMPGSGKKGIQVPVVHVSNWPDKMAVSAEVTERLSALLEQNAQAKRAMYEKAGSSAVGDENKLLPVVHCRAGVGRTAQVIGAMAMHEPRNNQLSVEDVVSSMRTSRNGVMVQKQEQLEVLMTLAQHQQRPLLRA
ncbi:protein-tyrosine phosphatase family protein [Aeromonas allosaccharophila]|uniref:protein-tyrosine phosphatase family protein n=1 Tax=Aeromonas allosaccharophila TaxID=656 RepID=UPI00111A08A1|nr:protein-tyrosine phosphatase family protein [Aeromonas allosaccharophila]